MYKKYFIYTVLIAVIILAVRFTSNPRLKKFNIVFENGAFLKTEVAETERQLREGLMFRTELKENSGMLFMYPKSGVRSFWMKNTLIPLDILWINENFEIVYILKNVPPCESNPCPSYAPQVSAKYAIEAPGGWTETKNITEGMRITIDSEGGVPR